MLTICLTKDRNIISEIVCDKWLWTLTNGQSETADIRHYIPDPSWDYLVVKDGIHLVGLFSLRKQTEMTIEAHIRILPSYWGSLVPNESMILLFQWLIKNTKAINVITYVPSNCDHVIKFLKDFDVRVCGLIKDGIIYNRQLVDLLIMNKVLIEE